MENEPKHGQSEILPLELGLEHAKDTVNRWNFTDATEEQNNLFATQICHWLIEVYGQPDDTDNFALYTNGEGWSGDLMPESMKEMITQYGGHRLYQTAENKVSIRTQHLEVYQAGYVPESVLRLHTFAEQIAYLKEHPEVAAMITKDHFEYLPQLSMIYQPMYVHEWGLEFIVAPQGVEVYPFGTKGATRIPYAYACRMQELKPELAKTVCDLSLLAAEHAYARHSGKMTLNEYELLHERLSGKANIPVIPSVKR